jgi:hypothetical protein
VAVDGILGIAEHGDYPVNAKGQRLYPRRHFWEQITTVLSTSERRHEIPIFTDKHLAVSWTDAKWIYDTGNEWPWAVESFPRAPAYFSIENP